MAIFRLSVSKGNKSDGASAGARARYVLRLDQYRHGAAELVTSYHLNMPTWSSSDPKFYWDTADQYERSNGVLFRQIILALPVGPFSQEDHKAMTDELLAAILPANEALPVTVAIHRGGEDGHNPHVHVMISERINDGVARAPEAWFKRYDSTKVLNTVGARKSEVLRKKQWLLDTRAAWANIANRWLESRGLSSISEKSWVTKTLESIAAGNLDPDAIGEPPSHICGIIKRVMDRGERVRSNVLYNEAKRILKDVKKVHDFLNFILQKIEEKKRQDEDNLQNFFDQIIESAPTSEPEPEPEAAPEPLRAPASDCDEAAIAAMEKQARIEAVVSDVEMVRTLEDAGLTDDEIVCELTNIWDEQRLEQALIDAEWDDDRVWRVLDPDDYEEHHPPDPDPPRRGPSFNM